MNRRRALMSVVSSSPAPVHGTWEDLFARIADGTYATAYSVGEILPLDLGTEGVVNAQIVAFNTDNKADDSGKAKVSFISQYLLATSAKMSATSGTYAKWHQSAMRTYLNGTIKALIPESIRSRIVQVTKYTREDGNAGYSGTEELWIPSGREVFGASAGSNSMEANGVMYTSVFSSDTARTKRKASVDTSISWWTRTQVVSGKNYANVKNDGGYSYGNGYNSSLGVALGFCID